MYLLLLNSTSASVSACIPNLYASLASQKGSVLTPNVPLRAGARMLPDTAWDES